MTDAHWQRLRPLLVQCCISLFKSRDILIEEAGEDRASPAGGDQVVACIGFEGEQMTGKMMLAAPYVLLQHAHPLAAGGAPLPEGALRDWICELVNQLLGRLKNVLVAHGVSFKVGLPRCFIGANFRRFYEPRSGSRVISLRWREMEARLQIQASVSRRVEFPDAAELPEGRPREGDVILF